MFSRNNNSALKHLDFVESSIVELWNNRSIVERKFVPHVVSPLSVAINKQGKKRLILDLSKVNKLLWKESFTFEDWKIGLEYFEENSFSFKFD